MEFKELVNAQYTIGEDIESLARNFSKDSSQRKTSTYYKKKLDTLTRWAEDFHQNHQDILAIEERPDDKYFKDDYYTRINEIITRHIKLFEQGAMQLFDLSSASGGLPLKSQQNLPQQVDVETRKLLRNQRALMRALAKTIDEVTAGRDTPHHSTYFPIKASVIEKYMMDLACNNTAIWASTDEEEIDGYTPNTYYEMESRAEAAMIELQQHIPLENVNESHRATRHMNTTQVECDIPLPRITLPKFDGSYTDWTEFKDLYCELVHNTNISETKKFHYLTSVLEGEAKRLIKHLPPIGQNYAAAWAILTSRYDNKRLLVSTLLNKLMAQPATKSELPNTIKDLHDVTKECVHGLKSQGLPVQHWDAIIAHIIIKKLDQTTQIAFEQSIEDNKRLIKVEELLTFLERRFQSFEARGKSERTSSRTCASATKTNDLCKICKKEAHLPYSCKIFIDADINKKWKWVKEMKLCVNCLRPGHKAEECKSRNCTKCSRKHNTLMHNSQRAEPSNSLQENKSPNEQFSTKEKSKGVDPATKVSLLSHNSNMEQVLLSTARIKLISATGQKIECRAVLDCGSQISSMTERLSRKLGNPIQPSNLTIGGFADTKAKSRHVTTVQIQSRISDFTATIKAHIVPRIVTRQPDQFVDISDWNIPNDIILADPEFNKIGNIDCLLGNDIFLRLLQDGQLELADHLPLLQNTKLGWIVGGEIGASETNTAVCSICTTQDLEKAITKFWEVEDIPESVKELTEDELHCESHFLQNTKRARDGKFIVRLPLTTHPTALPDSRGMAFERLRAIERRLDNNPALREQYASFMREYIDLGHMTEINFDKITYPHYFIPHHCVLRPDSLTTKLRVVFDASAHKSIGPSLNDIMHNGPKVQSDLFTILLRFRIHKYVLKTDVEKMYRQIWVHEDDRNLQLILWRDNTNQPIKTYQLNTVTYGTRAAPYLATRCLKQLAVECQGQLPYGASALKNDFYVDDGLIGADTIREALLIQEQLITILSQAGMKLKKWCANHPKLVQGIAVEDQEINLNFDCKQDQSTKTLGLMWHPKEDAFRIKATVTEHERITKRTMSSDLAHIYDPLGLIGPVIVTGKIQLQKTWLLKLDWDDELPDDIQKQWAYFKGELSALDNVKIPRHVLSSTEYSSMDIHAFSDASEKAYGAAIYIRTIQKDKTTKVNLLCSKSRVAPVKTQTIPRLELCAAQLAAELLNRVIIDLNFQNTPAYCWTDSNIVLSWIHNQSGKLPVFVAHRVVKILKTTIPQQWRHVPSKANPADILSRGLKPREFSESNTWLYGPLFLHQPKERWPAPFRQEFMIEGIEGTTPIVAIATAQNPQDRSWIYLIPSRNSFTFVQRVVGYVLRFVNNVKNCKNSRSKHLSLSPLELETALKYMVCGIQESDFADTKATLLKDKFVSNRNNLCSLTPFLDEEGIIRVGGRLNSSDQQYDAIHQMLLPHQDPLVKLLAEKVHKEHFHCGPQALLAQLRQRFWPLQGKNLVRSVVKKCIRCTRAKPTTYSQLMGNLPNHRVQPARPFLNSGIDYCGPFYVHYKVRGKRPQKAYLAVFCCFATKAVHLEVVTELTTEAFIGALKRFIARRGHCKTLYCDNATNFVGAKNQLSEMNEVVFAKSSQENIVKTCSSKGIDFQFIPPRSPHFGGLWEAAVKSAKHLLLKNVATASLTYEELETVVIEIEAILNSRPLIPSSSDANDFNAITPGHFLIGEELTSSVDVHAAEPTRRLSERWNLVSKLKHNFWQRWSKEYLSELQQRHKWKGPVAEIHPNTMVIIKEDNLPVLQWPLGRVIKTYKGKDGLVRVCDVKTEKGVFTRSLNRLAPLFPEDNQENSSRPNQETLQTQDSPVALAISIPKERIRNLDNLTREMPPKKVMRLSPTTILAIIALLLIPLASGNPILVAKLKNTPGIFFEQLQDVKLVTANWDIIVYYDLTSYQDDLHAMTDGISTLQKLCDNLPSNETTCTFLLNHFDETSKALQSEFDLFTTKRVKRGAVDVIGNIAYALFGTLLQILFNFVP